MPIFRRSYDRLLEFSGRKNAPIVLSVLSFLESFILPFPPPDVLLMPMAMAKPTRAFYFASLTLGFSVLGGLVGYLIGVFLFDQVQPYLVDWGYQAAYDRVIVWFQQWGFWAILIAGFSPIPYKIFTIAAGALNLAILPFILASAIGRGARFFLLAGCVAKFGPAVESKLLAHIETVGWATVVGLILIMLIYYV